MKKSNKKIACGFLAAAVLATGVVGCGDKKLDGSEIVATIDGEEVTLGLASYMTRDQQAQTESYYQMMAQSYGLDMSTVGIWDEEGEDGKTYGETTKENVLDTLKMLYGMKAHAKEYDVTISEEEKAKIEEATQAFMEANSEEILAELAVSEDDIYNYMELMTYRQKMHDPMVADVDKEVSDKEANQTTITMVKVSTEGTEKDEDGNTIELTEEEKAEKKELAEKVLKKVKAADDVKEADMSALAKEVDESLTATTPSFTTAGSEDDILDEEVKEAVAELKDGELVQEVVEGTTGYFVVRLDQKLDKEATENERELIISRREQDAYDALVEEWTKDVKMDVDKKVWKKVKLTDKKSYQYKTEETETAPAK